MPDEVVVTVQKVPPRKKLFPLGRVLITNGAADLLLDNGRSVDKLLWRHQHGDWGEMDKHDSKENVKAVRNKSRIMSSYVITADTGSGKIWIITDAGHYTTTVLLPNEY